MKQLITTLALLIAINLAGISTAQAAIKVYVKNCHNKTMNIGTFNPNDGVQLNFYQDKDFSEGDGKSLKCQGQSKGYCRVSNQYEDNDKCQYGTFNTKVQKNKWIKITDCKSYEKNLSSEPSCD